MAKGNANPEFNDILLIGGGLAIAYFGIIKPILNNLGVTDDANAQLVNNQATLPDDQNPFSVNFGPLNADKILNLDSINLTVQAIQQNSGSNFLGISTGPEYSEYWAPLADTIYHSMGFFWIDENAVVAAFNQVQSQADIWQMAVYMQAKYGVDMWNWIKKGQSFTPYDNGLSKPVLAQIIQHVNQLPLTTL